MKFADDFLTELKTGDILIFAGDPDSDFYTHKAEYEVHQDEQGLYVIDDQGEGEELNEVLAQYFVIKEPDTATLRSELEKWQSGELETVNNEVYRDQLEKDLEAAIQAGKFYEQKLEQAHSEAGAYRSVCERITENETNGSGSCRYCQAEEYPVDENGERIDVGDSVENAEWHIDHEKWCPSQIIDDSRVLGGNAGKELLAEAAAMRFALKDIKDDIEGDFTEEELSKGRPFYRATLETINNALALSAGTEYADRMRVLEKESKLYKTAYKLALNRLYQKDGCPMRGMEKTCETSCEDCWNTYLMKYAAKEAADE